MTQLLITLSSSVRDLGVTVHLSLSRRHLQCHVTFSFFNYDLIGGSFIALSPHPSYLRCFNSWRSWAAVPCTGCTYCGSYAPETNPWKTNENVIALSKSRT